jgi:hypothetical protein
MGGKKNSKHLGRKIGLTLHIHDKEDSRQGPTQQTLKRTHAIITIMDLEGASSIHQEAHLPMTM